VAVAIVAPGRGDGDGRVHRVEEARRIGRRTVVRNLQHIGAQQLGPEQQLLLRHRVDVAGQQDATVSS
jgi:hypothetical protein